MKVVALAGGVGGAKLADGLARVLPPQDLTLVVNTGDDFEHFGLSISPDLDTVCYTLAGKADPRTGWGQQGDTGYTFAALQELGAPDWFRLGDRDLALHLERTRLLHSGLRLSQVVAGISERWGIGPRVLPMSDDPVRTRLRLAGGGEVDFQDYFVRQGWQPVLSGLRFQGAEAAVPAPGVLEALTGCDLVVLCPSNPLLSIDPILAVPGILEAVRRRPVVAVSPIVAGQAVKGPLAKMVRELFRVEPSPAFVAGYYRGRFPLAGLVLDREDSAQAGEIRAWGIICEAVPTVMHNTEDRADLARETLALGQRIVETGRSV